jgi:predicted acylesterase/phospholipase RssA
MPAPRAGRSEERSGPTFGRPGRVGDRKDLVPGGVGLVMKKLGLALSGGGFRASLYHLGLLRFLRDAGILSQVTHITSVSGGSVMAAHLALNWNRYSGSASEFDAAASELLSFVRMDLRNRIIRRVPLVVPLRMARKLLGRSNRKLTRTGLLEYHYETYLYGDTSLFELPEKPYLHILATNLNEGCLCAFSRQGLLWARPQPGHTFRLDRVNVGLATVAMAVAASSAFPGFFPPLELTGSDVGANAGEFGRQSFTDGAVFDNLGVRMFRFLERTLLADSPLSNDDFFDSHETLQALRKAAHSGTETPLHRLWQMLTVPGSRPEPVPLTNGEHAQFDPPAPLQTGAGDSDELVLANLWNLTRRYQFYHDPVFTNLKPADPAAEALMRTSRSGGRVLDMSERIWLNRHLLEAAFREATGRACFRRLDSGLDGVLVSDVGRPMKVQANRRAGGLIRTAMRASDILMDRVGQLEKETFYDTPGFVFALITDVVEPSEDATALNPAIQRQVANIRTDFDRFSELEISSLIRHGYCVGRKACLAQPELFGTNLPTNSPWDPVSGGGRGGNLQEVPPPNSTPSSTAPPPAAVPTEGSHPTAGSPAPLSPAVGPTERRPPGGKAPGAATVEARTLQASSGRRIWSTLLDYRDWASYIYVPIIVPLLSVLPYVLVKYYEHTHKVNQIVKSLSQGSQDLEQMSRLLDSRSTPWPGVPFEEVGKVSEADVKDFEVLQDSRILDLRGWKPGASDSLSFGYRRLKVFKNPDYAGDDQFYMNLIATDPKTAVRFPPQELQPKLRRGNVEKAGTGEEKWRWQAVYDCRQVPPGETVDLIVEYYSPGQYLQNSESATVLPFFVRWPTAELTMWVMMPTGKEYSSWRLSRYPQGNPQQTERVKAVTEYLAEDYTILAFKLLSLKPGYVYNIQWTYK